MPRYLMHRIVKLWSSCGLCHGLWETGKAALTSVQPSRRRGSVFYHVRLLGFNNDKALCLSYSLLLELQGLLIYDMVCSI